MAEADFQPSWSKLLVSASLFFLVSYGLIFSIEGSSIGKAVGDSMANVLPLAVLSALTHSLLKLHVLPRRGGEQMAIHVGAAILFALAWYSLVIVALGITSAVRGQPFDVVPFRGPAFVWMSFQGLVLYTLVAATTYALRGGRQADTAKVIEEARKRYLVRIGDGLSPISTEDIVAITGAQDYSEVATARGRHLVRLSLNEFETQLDRSSFVRVHRSAILNLDRLERTEPAGSSRMVAWMDNGDSIPVSRAGAQLLRSLAV